MNTGVAKPIPAAWVDVIDDYCLDQAAAGRPSTTIGTRRGHLARMSRELCCTPEQVDGTRLKRWFGRQRHWEIETRRSYRNTFRSFYAWGFREGHFVTPHSDGLPHVKARKPSPRPAPEDVWNVAIAAADRSTDRRLGLMLRLAAHGLRRAEVAKVEVNDVTHGPGGYVLLVHGKGDKERTVPIANTLAMLILRGAAGHTPGLSDSGFLFPGADGGHLSPRWVGTLCARIMPGVWTMHTLRHRCATRAFRATRNLRAVQEMMGHQSLATTENYTYVDDDEVRAAMMAAVTDAA